MIQPQYDVMGEAGLDYLVNGPGGKDIKVWCDIAENDILPVKHLFRSFAEMPVLEQIAMNHARGRVLDVGAGMGSHTLHLQSMGLDVTALEISAKCCEVISKRGVRNVINSDFFNCPVGETYDTMLFMMNGIGLVGTTDGFPRLFRKIDELLSPEGQVLLDSSDLRYLFLEDDGSMLINLNDKYYGEVVYRMSYGNIKGKSFKWLFIDSELLSYYAEQHGFRCEKIADGTHFDYLARLVKL